MKFQKSTEKVIICIGKIKKKKDKQITENFGESAKSRKIESENFRLHNMKG